MAVSILIGGDLCPTKSNYALFKKADVLTLFGQELLDVLNNSDIRIFNLEVPLTDVEIPIEKCGVNLLAPTYVIKGIKAIGPSVFGLSNNHILDQGEQGLFSTMNLLTENGILYVGAGRDIDEAAQPLFIERNDIIIGLYCCAEHEFTIATKTSGGANPFDILTSFEHIRRTRQKCDYLIVLYHGGKEHYQYPSPNVQIWCRKMVENGADLIVCQHSHCIGCEENYLGAKIVYGQGNFIFDHSKNELWNSGLLILAEIEFDNKINIQYIPIQRINNTVRLAAGEAKQKILNGFYVRSNSITDDLFVKKNYEIFARDMINHYLTLLFKIKTLQSVLKIVRKFFGNKLFHKFCLNKPMLVLLNMMECEAHRELFITGLKMTIKDRE
jgi:poly-gamma-glutamate synthesis protein (capsule biosynthesis protein)